MSTKVSVCSGERIGRMIDLGIVDFGFRNVALVGDKAVLDAKLHSLLFTWHDSDRKRRNRPPPIP